MQVVASNDVYLRVGHRVSCVRFHGRSQWTDLTQHLAWIDSANGEVTRTERFLVNREKFKAGQTALFKRKSSIERKRRKLSECGKANEEQRCVKDAAHRAEQAPNLREQRTKKRCVFAMQWAKLRKRSRRTKQQQPCTIQPPPKMKARVPSTQTSSQVEEVHVDDD